MFAVLCYPMFAGSAVGFRLDSLLKLTDTRARNNRMTLMHYLCKVAYYQKRGFISSTKDSLYISLTGIDMV